MDGKKIQHEQNEGRQLSLEAQIFINGGNPFEALKTARKYDQVKITVSLELVERAFIAWYINFGWTNEMIVNALSTDDRKITVARIERMRRKLDEEAE